MTSRLTNGAEAEVKKRWWSWGVFRCKEWRRRRRSVRTEPKASAGWEEGNTDRQVEQRKEERASSVFYLQPQPDSHGSWRTPQLPYAPPSPRPSPCPTFPCRFRKSTPSTTVGTWPASSSFCSSSSPLCPWPLWPSSTSYWTAAAAPKGKRATSCSRKGREAAASS